MRTIKFRAWHKITQTMRKVDELTSTGGLSLELNGTFVESNTRESELLQFTGLKDKNGKEIYEGDIIGYWANACWPVFWGKTKTGFCFGGNNWESLLSPSSIKNKIVIGNIYENPELLKEENAT